MNEETVNAIIERLTRIERFLKFIARPSMIEEIKRIATTEKRQLMWILCNGKNSTEDIARCVEASVRAVQYFIDEAEQAGLIEFEKRGYPKRICDVFPPDWNLSRLKRMLKKRIEIEKEAMKEAKVTIKSEKKGEVVIKSEKEGGIVFES